jgi:hypothetical protein
MSKDTVRERLNRVKNVKNAALHQSSHHRDTALFAVAHLREKSREESRGTKI